jgi:hypothetical protein
MRTEPRFVTPSDFLNYTGKDLSHILKTNNNISNAPNLFLMMVEDTLLTRIDTMSFRTRRWEDLTGYQLESLQKAIIHQANYVLRNGDIFSDSGYDLERGEIIPYEKLQAIAVCSTSKDLLRNCGLLNQKLPNKNRYLDFK